MAVLSKTKATKVLDDPQGIGAQSFGVYSRLDVCLVVPRFRRLHRSAGENGNVSEWSSGSFVTRSTGFAF
jgi:hypothetical protein